MTLRTRLLILLLVLICVALIVRQVRRREMRARYLVLWVSLCVVVLPLAAIPNALDWISGVLGIYYGPATFFLAAVVILFLVSIEFSNEISKLDERTRILAEELALARLAQEPREPVRQLSSDHPDLETTSSPQRDPAPTAAPLGGRGAS